MKKIIIAIDGFAGCGKSTTAKLVARQLDYIYIDTGAMYRAVTLFVLDKGLDFCNAAEVEAVLPEISLDFAKNPDSGEIEIQLNGQFVEPRIRTQNVSEAVSYVAAMKGVRKLLVDQQRLMGQAKGVVMDGRDIGTVVFPQAELKIFMITDVDARTERRLKEMLAKGQTATFEEIKQNLLERDRLDSERAEDPLRKADDAVTIDTSRHTIDSQTQEVLRLARLAMGE